MIIKILIAYHKKAKLIKSNIFQPIQVGRDIMLEENKDGHISKKEQNWLLKNLMGDNTGDNISKLNRYFNEMSALYWGWKNQDKLNNPDYIGLMHYRRHFIFNRNIKKPKFTWLNKSNIYSYLTADKFYIKNILNEDNIKELASQYDILCSKQYNANNLLDGHYYQNCKDRFAMVSKTDKKWYEKMYNIILNKYPQYATELKELENTPTHYLCNMFVMKKDLYNEYCEFAFNVLFELYNELNNENFNTWQMRCIGFLAEFLTSIFISNYKKRNPKKVLELDLTYIEENENKNRLINIFNWVYSKKKYSTYQITTIFGKKRYKKINDNIKNILLAQNEQIIVQQQKILELLKTKEYANDK